MHTRILGVHHSPPERERWHMIVESGGDRDAVMMGIAIGSGVAQLLAWDVRLVSTIQCLARSVVKMKPTADRVGPCANWGDEDLASVLARRLKNIGRNGIEARDQVEFNGKIFIGRHCAMRPSPMGASVTLDKPNHAGGAETETV
ncbi:uncharacterized protein BJ212DRAFT_1297953 [Suillus subaureus]|uniref:Uncharacterized protein n=1 Tax=Suillus subaureus TaxID=48587 RepID=A0A9P7EGZ1_9AGAM|nr:uncharacterized protein BJ212DRAFT_1297953 [Suillus subaureus]KAG1820591.1 hypothetical protein BJ212DRAFT_1297953 [Suillus subaureus]